MDNKSNKIEISGINAESGLDICDGDVDIYIQSLRLYVSNMPAVLEKLRGVSEKTLRDYLINVHGLKGMSEYIGAEEIRKTAKQLEAMSKEGDLAGVLAVNDSFIKSTENLICGIQDWLNKYGSREN